MFYKNSLKGLKCKFRAKYFGLPCPRKDSGDAHECWLFGMFLSSFSNVFGSGFPDLVLFPFYDLQFVGHFVVNA